MPYGATNYSTGMWKPPTNQPSAIQMGAPPTGQPYSGAFKPPGYNPSAPSWRNTNTWNFPKSGTMGGMTQNAQPQPIMTMDTSPKPTGMTQDSGASPAITMGGSPATGMIDTAPQPDASMGMTMDTGPKATGMTDTSLPMPENSTYGPPGLNMPYATPDNVGQYANPFLQSIMDKGKAAVNWDPGTRPERLQATPENLNMYADPSYQYRLDQGMHALESGAAARGGLLSSGHMQNAIDYSQNAASQEWQNQFNRFNTAQDNAQNDWLGDRNFGLQKSTADINSGIGADANINNAFNADRNFMNNNYWDTYDRGYKATKDANDQNWEQYKYGNADYKGLLSDYYSGNNNIVNMGSNAANNAGTIQGNLGEALAQLFGQGGNVGAASAINGGNANGDFLSSLMGAFGSYMGGK